MDGVQNTKDGSKGGGTMFEGIIALSAYLLRVQSRADEKNIKGNDIINAYAMLVYIVEGREVDTNNLDDLALPG